ncbi:uncharacterized protein LOC109280969 isoform X2 [Alligator mississippiensis]|uniref:uncharacterized protein LOC109280969 isoform X2 n=1 Tax=Alligator mississippiensis TaxID=8496 RepID=UPI002877A1E1|nr:uncharacterized protein LOC109280969 isoform X2 [Alligator mississippiensis]
MDVRLRMGGEAYNCKCIRLSENKRSLKSEVQKEKLDNFFPAEKLSHQIQEMLGELSEVEPWRSCPFTPAVDSRSLSPNVDSRLALQEGITSIGPRSSCIPTKVGIFP